jgi:hypothetical protein
VTSANGEGAEPARTPGDGDTHIDEGATARAELRALFDEFVSAKRAHSENVDDLAFDQFSAALADERLKLLTAHRCRDVRFEVRIQDGEVSLLPRLLR